MGTNLKPTFLQRRWFGAIWKLSVGQLGSHVWAPDPETNFSAPFAFLAIWELSVGQLGSHIWAPDPETNFPALFAFLPIWKLSVLIYLPPQIRVYLADSAPNNLKIDP